MTTKKEKKQFARQFSYSDWLTLCNSIEFLDALGESLAAAEIAAHQILNAASPEINN